MIFIWMLPLVALPVVCDEFSSLLILSRTSVIRNTRILFHLIVLLSYAYFVLFSDLFQVFRFLIVHLIRAYRPLHRSSHERIAPLFEYECHLFTFFPARSLKTFRRFLPTLA